MPPFFISNFHVFNCFRVVLFPYAPAGCSPLFGPSVSFRSNFSVEEHSFLLPFIYFTLIFSLLLVSTFYFWYFHIFFDFPRHSIKICFHCFSAFRPVLAQNTFTSHVCFTFQKQCLILKAIFAVFLMNFLFSLIIYVISWDESRQHNLRGQSPRQYWRLGTSPSPLHPPLLPLTGGGHAHRAWRHRGCPCRPVFTKQVQLKSTGQSISRSTHLLNVTLSHRKKTFPLYMCDYFEAMLLN